MRKNQKHKGFTLLEILLVVAAIGILAGIVILAINPSKQLADTKNAQRRSDVNTILNGIYQYAVDNSGVVPAAVVAGTTCNVATQEVCKTGAVSCAGLTDLAVLTTNGKYLVAMPSDPTGATTNGTGYFVYKNANNRVTVCAPNAEEGASISVTR
ncbi:type II secretion system protein [Candidatus Parcubacteria bacterium]|jgi:type IV pilus assembly protein PilA|nr:MAG: type II secretion system protein [Candidatus Parcubacteria bacterium]